jgi:hypothetical protein
MLKIYGIGLATNAGLTFCESRGIGRIYDVRGGALWANKWVAPKLRAWCEEREIIYSPRYKAGGPWHGGSKAGWDRLADDLVRLAARRRSPLSIALACACKAPGDCHIYGKIIPRVLALAAAQDLEIDVRYVWRDEVITHAALAGMDKAASISGDYECELWR